MMDISLTIKLKRIQIGMTQMELAEKAGCNNITISRLESGCNVGTRVLEKVCNVLNIGLTDKNN